MSATSTQIARLRRMVAEPTTTIYSDGDLAAIIEEYPLRDGADYDLNAAAAAVWDEKAAALAARYDVSADGATHALSQKHAHAQAQSRHYRSRRRPGTIRLRPEPRPSEFEDVADT